MTIALTEDDILIRESVSRFVRREYEANAHPTTDTDLNSGRWRTFAELGWLGLAAGLDGGSLAEGVQQVSIMCEELGRALAPEPLLPYAILSSAVLRALADVPLARERLDALGTGEWLPLLLCDSAPCQVNVAMTAERFGDRFKLNGKARRLLGGAFANSYLVPAHLDDKIVLFELLPETAGIERTDFRTIDGRQMSDISFTDTPATLDQLLIQSKNLAQALAAAWNHATVAICAEMVGIMFHALTLTRDYLNTRRQFGRPIAEFQALRHKLAEMFVEVQQARSMLMRGIIALQQPNLPHVTREIHAMKARVNLAGKRVGAEAIQLHGGIGMTEEYVIGRCYKRLLVDSKLLGDTRLRLKAFNAAAAI